MESSAAHPESLYLQDKERQSNQDLENSDLGIHEKILEFHPSHLKFLILYTHFKINMGTKSKTVKLENPKPTALLVQWLLWEHPEKREEAEDKTFQWSNRQADDLLPAEFPNSPFLIKFVFTYQMEN